ncbi:MAG: PspA/IM30 family protein [Nitrospirae bacterium]|uniref:Putative phage shock protein A (PspA) n=1 Tax=Leptospirillum ferrodiazotrophum TaxID=412449 RepID=C6HV56_9BACT|nr:MAG: putative phage shock protein A (PspA) [Leptospirillum ferrodiazotrophum]MCL5954128.1 PspA/IM30 family protein [Nitrospirota bacterium]
MGLLDRMKTIFQAQANATLDTLEDPKAMIAQQLRNLDDKLQSARGELVKAMAEVKLLEQKMGETQEQIDLYQQRAEKSVAAGNDDLARKALLEKSRLSGELADLTRQRDDQKKIVDELSGDLDSLTAMRDDFARKQSNLTLREERAKAKEEINAVRAEIDPHHIGQEMGRMADKISRMEAQAEATKEYADRQKGSDLDSAFASLDAKKPDIEAELALLKQKKS